uniref:Uncharacterized protein n=1 Tax=Physcomitrium patens TaxID=3218 RepID=A0A2K1JY41_PHYPA|nr:hypothetical protein PHYPA_013559 [Physcomitrium patens]
MYRKGFKRIPKMYDRADICDVAFVFIQYSSPCVDSPKDRIGQQIFLMRGCVNRPLFLQVNRSTPFPGVCCVCIQFHDHRSTLVSACRGLGYLEMLTIV